MKRVDRGQKDERGHEEKKEGGGGHCKAAGALWDCSLLEAKERVLFLLKKSFNAVLCM